MVTIMKKHGIAWLFLALSICVMAISGFKLSEIRQTYKIGDEGYSKLADMVRADSASSAVREINDPFSHSENPEGQPLANPKNSADEEQKPGPGINFEVLQQINPDGEAWLYCPGTMIDYPVIRATDYDYYLHHLPDGTPNSNGSLFIDYNNAPDFSDELTVIYGHNMKYGGMFGSLTEYKKQQYYVEHPYMYLYTPKGNYRVDLLYGCVIGAGEWRERAFMYEVNLQSLLAYAKKHTTFKSGSEYGQGDRIVALSTCTYEFNDARYVVIGALRPE